MEEVQEDTNSIMIQDGKIKLQFNEWLDWLFILVAHPQHEEEVVLRDEVVPPVAENAVDLLDPQPTLIRKIHQEEDRLL